MTTHELARILLAYADVPVYWSNEDRESEDPVITEGSGCILIEPEIPGRFDL